MDNSTKVKCECGEEKCPGNKCSIKLFMNKFGKNKLPNENIVEFLKRMNMISTHKLFPIWDHHYNATKNKMHKFVTSSKKFVDGVNYCRISAKTHPRVWQNVKKLLDCPDTSWSVVYVDQELANVLKQKMLAGRWGNIAGAHERNALELLFQMGTEKETENVPFKNFLLAAHKFFIDFPAWKKIQSTVESMVVGTHKKVNKSFIDRWIRDILASLMERMHIEIKDDNCNRNNMNPYNNNNNNNNNSDINSKFNDNMLVSRQLAESFFNAFAGLAHTILPTTIPIIDLSVFQKPGSPSVQQKCDDLLYHWASSSIHSVSGEEAEKILLQDNIENGTYLIRISHHYLWALATVGINKIINEEKFSKHVGPIIICYKNNDGFYEQLITFQIMHLTTISNQLSAIPELRHCVVCKQLCFKPKVCDSSFTTQLPSSTPNHSNNFSPYSNFKNNVNNNNNINYNNNNNFNYPNNNNNYNNNNNNISNNNTNDNMNLNNDFAEYELLTSSFVSVNMNDGNEPKRMKRERGDNMKIESPFNSSAFNTPIYCIDHGNDPSVLSILQIKLHKTPDVSLQDAVIRISYHDNKTYTVECEKIMYSSKCLVPFIGKPSPVESKILVIKDPKITTTHFLKYIPKMNVWCCGVIEADTSYEVSPGKQIFTDPPLGDTVLFCLSKNDFTPESLQEKDVSNNPFNNNFLMDTTPLNFDTDNNGDFDFSFLNSPTSVSTSFMINSSKKSPLSSPRSPRSPLSTSGILNLNGPSINPLFSFN